jgi:hypothetical protein
MTKTVDLKTAVTRPEDIRELTDTQMTLSYSIFDVMQSRLHAFASKHAAFNDLNWNNLYDEVQSHMYIIKAEHIAKFPEQWFVWEFRASCPDAKFIEGMTAGRFDTGMEFDSTNDWLAINTSDDRKEEVETFLRTNFPNLILYVEPADTSEQDLPAIFNWDASIELVEKAGITVVVEMPELTPKPQEKIDEMMEKAAAILQKTGLSRIEAMSRLAKEMGVDPIKLAEFY